MNNSELNTIKDYAIDFVCDQVIYVIDDVIDANTAADEKDLKSVRNKVDSLITICHKVKKCRDEKSIKKLLRRYYDIADIVDADIFPEYFSKVMVKSV
jgi:uncharacterized membrane protein